MIKAKDNGAVEPIIANRDDLPEGWAATTLGDVVIEVQPGFACGVNNRDGDGVAHLRPMNINTEGAIDLTDVKYVPMASVDSKRKWLRKSDVLFNNTNSTELVGKTAIYNDDEPRAFSNHMTRVRVNENIIDPAFCAAYLHNCWRDGHFQEVCNQHVSQSSVSRTRLIETSLPLPPLAEQKRIVTKVEALLARVNKARERLSRVPDILKKFRQSVLAAACSGRLTADWREENGEGSSLDVLLEAVEDERKTEWPKRLGRRRYREPITELHGDLFEIPDSWRWVTFDRCSLDITVGHVGSMRDKYVPDGVPFLRSQNVRPLRFDTSGMVFIPASFDEQLSKSRLYGGEILVTRSGANTGDCCVYPVDAPQANCSDVVISRPLSILNAHYGAIFVCSPEGEAYLRRGETGIAQPHFNTKAMRNTPLPLPPPTEQREIVMRTGRLLALADRVENHLNVATARAERIQQSLLAKAFAGELVETEADLASREGRDYELASVLLERIAIKGTAGRNGKPKREAKSRARK